MPVILVPFRDLVIEVVYPADVKFGNDVISRNDVTLSVALPDRRIRADCHGFAVEHLTPDGKPDCLHTKVAVDSQTARGRPFLTPIPCSPLTNLQAAMIVPRYACPR